MQAPVGYTGTEMLATGLLSFGAGMALGALINEDDDDWDCGWSDGGGSVHYNNNVYVSNSPVPPRGNGNYPARPPAANRPGGVGGAGGVGRPGGVGGPGRIGRPGWSRRTGRCGRPRGSWRTRRCRGTRGSRRARQCRGSGREPGGAVLDFCPAGYRTIYPAIQSINGQAVRGNNPNIAKPTFPGRQSLFLTIRDSGTRTEIWRKISPYEMRMRPAQPANRMASNGPATANRANNQHARIWWRS